MTVSPTAAPQALNGSSITEFGHAVAMGDATAHALAPPLTFSSSGAADPSGRGGASHKPV